FVPWKLFAGSGSAVLLLGVEAQELRWMPESFFVEVEQAAGRGNRVVLGLLTSRELRRPDTGDEAGMTRRWGVRVEVAVKEALEIRLAAGKEWASLDGDVMVERRFGKGSVVLVADGALFSNGSQARMPRGGQLAKILGGERRIVFEESHLGVVESGGIVKLALRYKMHGFLLGFLLWVALYVWKNASSFPPRRGGVERPMVAGRTSLSGLVTLLRRNVPEADVARIAFAAWRKTAERSYSRAEIERAARVMDSAAGPSRVVLERVRAELPRRGKGAE
ncbi:MAG: hypothetical protein NTY38_12700, partial [Acidobacteria bacterium]|nr:hypothetical protein [Acidobacteriota bacterium]